MSLQFGQGSVGTSNSTKVGEGAYVQKGRIIRARCVKNGKPHESWQYTDDIAIQMVLDIGMDWEKDLWIGGKFKKEQTPQGGEVISGWGSAFKAERIFSELGIEGELNTDMMIPDHIVQQLVGKELFFLDYAARIKDNGKVGYYTHNIVAANQDGESEEETIQRLTKSFFEDVEKGFVKKYDPSLASREEGDASFNFGANGSGANTSGGDGWGQTSPQPNQGGSSAPWN
jgi:hypothetical protein